MIKFMRIIDFMALLAIGLISLISCENATEKTIDITTYVGSGHPDWAPIMYKQGDLIVGAGPEITAKVFQELGLKTVVQYKGLWNEVLASAKISKIDFLVAAYKTAEREGYLVYSDKYTDDPVSIFVKKGKGFTFTKWDDLIGKQGVVMKGDSYGEAFDKFIGSKLKVDIVNNAAEAFAKLTAGQADYFVYAYYSGNNYMAGNNAKDKFEILPQNVASEGFYIAIAKQSPLIKYMPQINTILARMIKDGTIQQAIDKYKN